MKYYLGIDLGTTGTKTLLLDEDGKVLGKGYKGYNLITPKENFYEQSPNDWYDAVLETVRLSTVNFIENISALSVSAQGGSFVFCDVDEKGELIPLTNAITWLDRRAGLEAKELSEKAFEFLSVKLGAGSVLAKVLWVKKYYPDILRKTKLILSTSDYIYYKLTGRAVIDYTSAAMMGFFDNDNFCYNDKLLELFGLFERKNKRI